MVTVAAPAPITRARATRVVVRTVGPRPARPSMPAVLPGGHRDQLIVVEALTERPLAELRGAVIGKASWVLNGVGAMDWSMSSWDPSLLDCLVRPGSVRSTLDGRVGELELIGREVQWHRDGVLRWAGVPTSAKVDLAGTVQFGAFDLGWYLTRRFFGAAQRRDLLEGAGSMDKAGIPGWIRNGTAVAERDVTTKVRGIGSAALTGTGSIVKTYQHPPTGLAVSIAVHLVWQVRIPTGTPVDTPIATIEVRATPSGPVLSSGEVRTDEATRLGTFIPGETFAMLPPAGGYVTVRLHTRSFGTIRFDDVRSLKNDTTGIPVPGADLATHAIAGMNHFQLARGKGTFRFRPRKLSNSGTVEVMGVRHAEHQQALDYLRTLTDRADGIDWWIDPRTREFCVAHRRGRDHEHLVLHGRAVRGGGWSHDEQSRTTSVVVIGEGNGPGRPEGSYVDTSKASGLVLEELVPAANGVPLSALDQVAKQTWDQKSGPQVTPSPLTIDGDLLPELEPGDRFRTDLRSGVLVAAPLVRAETLTMDPAANTIEVT